MTGQSLDTTSTGSRAVWRRPILIGLVLAFGASLPVIAPPAHAQSTQDADAPIEPEYRIGPGDDLSVTFPYNAELDHDGPVGPDGRFTMPVVGNLPLAHRTVAEAAALISATLREQHIVADARPSVMIRQYGASVYVGGEVRQPGAVKLAGGMDALQAIIVAGGLLDTAKSRHIVIIRRGADGTPAMIYLDLRAYVRKGVPLDGLLRTQDVVFVPKSSIAEANVWVDQYINKLLPFSRSLNYSLGGRAVNTVLNR